MHSERNYCRHEFGLVSGQYVLNRCYTEQPLPFNPQHAGVSVWRMIPLATLPPSLHTKIDVSCKKFWMRAAGPALRMHYRTGGLCTEWRLHRIQKRFVSPRPGLLYYEEAKRQIQNRAPKVSATLHLLADRDAYWGTGAQSEGKGLPNQWRVLDHQASWEHGPSAVCLRFRAVSFGVCILTLPRLRARWCVPPKRPKTVPFSRHWDHFTSPITTVQQLKLSPLKVNSSWCLARPWRGRHCFSETTLELPTD
jgi:hypothetical protein